MIDRIRQFILKRRQAYRHVFMPDGKMGVASEAVLADLRRFCRGTATPAVVSLVTQQVDPIATGIAIGRQEVWHRICHNLHLTDADVYKMVGDNEGTE